MKSLYTNGQPAPTSPASRVHHVDGRDLAYVLRGTTADIRAKLAVAYAADGMVVHKQTDKQLAALFRTSVYRLAKARNGHGESLADHIARSTAAERLAAARALGADVVWEEMVLPLMEEDRALGAAE